jgi:hypothetical protein
MGNLDADPGRCGLGFCGRYHPGELPITQQSKFNLKPDDWKPLREAIDQYIAQLESSEKEAP